MVEFYNTFISPKSPTRAKIAVYLYAQSTTEGKEEVAELLKTLDLASDASAKVQAALLQPEKRLDAKGLRALLEGELRLPAAKVAAVLEAAAGPTLNATANGVSSGASSDGDEAEDEATVSLPTPVLITDVRAFRASLVASSGARPVRELSDYEELDSKL